uniref:phospholipid-transporting ATPase ABCA7 isoform X2 n=1 Tax=Myxine glutinosa TaxID=7769 RepID=UPI00358FEA38
MAFWNQLYLLLWKNVTLGRRHKFRFALEVVWPLFIFFILVSVRRSYPPQQQHECHFPSKVLPSAGLIPWIQSQLCNLHNPCFSYTTEGEGPGTYDNFHNSLLSRLLRELQESVVNLSRSLPPPSSAPPARQVLTLLSLFENSQSFSALTQDKFNLSAEATDNLLKMQVTEALHVLPALLNTTIPLFGSREPVVALCEKQHDPAQFGSVAEVLCRLAPEKRGQLVHALLSELQPLHLLKAVSPKLPSAFLKTATSVLARLSATGQEIWQALLVFRNESRDVWAGATPETMRQVSRPLGRLLCGYPENGLKTIRSMNPMEEQNLKAILGRDNGPEEAYVYDNTTTPFCNDLFARFESSPASRFVWRALQPLLLGKILYTPDSPVTRTIIREANLTFSRLASLAGLSKVWHNIRPHVWNFLESSPEVDGLRAWLKLPVAQIFLTKAFEQMEIGSKEGLQAISASDLLAFLTHGDGEQLNWQGLINATDTALDTFTQLLECMELNKFEVLSNEDLLVGRALHLLDMNRFWAAIVFVNSQGDDISSLPGHIEYKIRMDIDSVQRTNKIKDRYWDPGPRADPYEDLRYVWGGFTFLQDLVEHAAARAIPASLIRQSNSSSTRRTHHQSTPSRLSKKHHPTGVVLQQMPYPCYVDDIFLRVMGHSLPMFLTLACIYSVAMGLKAIVREKEARLREAMAAAGLAPSTLRLAWFLTCLAPLLLSNALLTLILKVGDILPYSSPSVLYVYLCFFSVATVSQTQLISTAFSRANLAAACGGLVYFAFYLPYVLCAAWEDHIPYEVKLIASGLSTVAFSFGVEQVALFEEQGFGVQWSNIAGSPGPGQAYSLTTATTMMALDAAIYALLTWYIENVWPGQYSVPRPWYFPLSRAYWCDQELDNSASAALGQDSLNDAVCIEPEPDLPVGVALHGLRKVYGDGKVAVAGLSLNFLQGHITSFLGHNGAGKTTTMSILTGLFPATSGSAYILGRDIRTEMSIIRRSLGTCPQHNVLFDSLTVEEHIWFYARLKGCPPREAQAEMGRMLTALGLPEKRRELSSKLSGGLQRRLSVALAFVGGSKVVFLDEPTAGVDPYSRRGIWDLLLHYRQGRTIVLSTHHMDEAELLGDRIAIVAGGRLRCLGSPLFLKTALGGGYHLTIVKRGATGSSHGSGLSSLVRPDGGQDPSLQDDQQSDTSMDEGFGSDESNPDTIVDVEAVSRLVIGLIPGARLLGSRGQELSYALPAGASQGPAFGLLFKELDDRLTELGIASYGLSHAGLEEIFLKVAQEQNKVTAKEPEIQEGCGTGKAGAGCCPPAPVISECDIEMSELNCDPELGELCSGEGLAGGAASDQLTGWALLGQQLSALLRKRLQHARRSPKHVIAQVVLPAFFVCLALVFTLLIPPFGKYPELELQPWMYGKQRTFVSNDAVRDAETTRLYHALINGPGFGTRCMDSNPISDLPCPHSRTDWTGNPTFSNYSQAMNDSPSCQCSTPQRQSMLPVCPSGAGGSPPMQRVQDSGEVLEELSGRNISDYLVKIYPQAIRERLKSKYWVNEVRYGGLSMGIKNPLVHVNIEDVPKFITQIASVLDVKGQNVRMVVRGMEELIDFLGPKNNIKVWFNNKGWHAVTSFLNVAHNAVLRASLPPSASPGKFGLTAHNYPLNLTRQQLAEVMLMTTSVDVLVSVCVIFAMSFVPAGFVVYLIQERRSKAKHLQLLSGLNPMAYWLANFAWDMMNYMVPALLVVVIFLCFQQTAYTSAANLPALVVLLILYGWAITPLMYPASFVFSVPSTAYVALTCANLFIGINGSLATFILELFEEDQNLKSINTVLKQIFLLFPHFCLGRGLMDMVKHQAVADALSRFGEQRVVNPLSWEVAGRNACAMAVEGVVFFFINLLVQHRYALRYQPRRVALKPIEAEDEDVARERMRVTSGDISDVVVLSNLTKTYSGKKKPAVDRVCVGIPRGECFGLLGVNGAGKTTTFKMLTGDTPISSGNAFLNGHSVVREVRAVHRSLGYCPQFDALDPVLSGREHLELYARLRGVSPQEVPRVVAWGLRRLGLQRLADRPAGTYSGGNRRKLSAAIAMVDCPPVLFLDEPTCGMDPASRRFLWDCVLDVVREGRSVVLTSHSMEECEVLCSRMAIMVNGRFQCLGSAQHLKSRFGDGYTVRLRVGGCPPLLGPVEAFVASQIPGAVLRGRQHTTLQYTLPAKQACLTRLFSALANNAGPLGIEDYSVEQTTLDQVFINFAKNQNDGAV